MIHPSDLSRGLPGTIFFSGVYMATFAAAGLFFMKFWSRTKEQFFLLFGAACWMLSVERLPLLLVDPETEPYTFCYLFRLIAFILILKAVWPANGTVSRTSSA